MFVNCLWVNLKINGSWKLSFVRWLHRSDFDFDPNTKTTSPRVCPAVIWHIPRDRGKSDHKSNKCNPSLFLFRACFIHRGQKCLCMKILQNNGFYLGTKCFMLRLLFDLECVSISSVEHCVIYIDSSFVRDILPLSSIHEWVRSKQTENAFIYFYRASKNNCSKIFNTHLFLPTWSWSSC